MNPSPRYIAPEICEKGRVFAIFAHQTGPEKVTAASRRSHRSGFSPKVRLVVRFQEPARAALLWVLHARRARASLVALLHAFKSLFKLRDEGSFAGLETTATQDAPEKTSAR
jgi:hypothetical protein